MCGISGMLLCFFFAGKYSYVVLVAHRHSRAVVMSFVIAVSVVYTQEFAVGDILKTAWIFLK